MVPQSHKIGYAWKSDLVTYLVRQIILHIKQSSYLLYNLTINVKPSHQIFTTGIEQRYF